MSSTSAADERPYIPVTVSISTLNDINNPLIGDDAEQPYHATSLPESTSEGKIEMKKLH